MKNRSSEGFPDQAFSLASPLGPELPEAPWAGAHLSAERTVEAAEDVRAADNTAPLQRGRPFRRGQSGNPGGRPRGSKNKLSEIFLATIAEDFLHNGAAAIEQLRTLDPAAYLKLVSSLVPRELLVQHEQGSDVDYADLSVAELAALTEAAGRRRYVEQALATAAPVPPPGWKFSWPGSS